MKDLYIQEHHITDAFEIEHQYYQDAFCGMSMMPRSLKKKRTNMLSSTNVSDIDRSELDKETMNGIHQYSFE